MATAALIYHPLGECQHGPVSVLEVEEIWRIDPTVSIRNRGYTPVQITCANILEELGGTSITWCSRL